MIKAFFKILTIPIVYIFLVIVALFKWLLVAPICFCLYFLKYAFVGAIIGIIAGFFLTPIATGIILLFVAIGSLSAVCEDLRNGFLGYIYIKWDYATTIFEENKADSLLRKRKKYIKLANKKYNNSKDEFYGFDQISDIYAK